jgi:poly-beta-1,6-N-acetyl-D-glucosamine N-deacetylase
MYKIRRLLAGIIGWLLVFFLFSKEKKKAFSGKYITCIYFHNPGTHIFEKCIKWLKRKGFIFISTEELSQIIKKKVQIPSGAIWITFDDGWRNNLEIVPIAQKHNVPITIFLATDAVENTGFYWWTLIRKYSNLLPDEYKNNNNLLWKIEDSKRITIFNDLRNKISDHIIREAMTVQESIKISGIQQVTLGSHTVNHSITSNCSPKELDMELRVSKEKIENWTGKTIKSFSYPNGDFNGKEKEVLTKYGYEIAVTSRQDYYNPEKNDPYYIPRFCTSEDSYLSVNICKMFGIWGRFFKGK